MDNGAYKMDTFERSPVDRRISPKKQTMGLHASHQALADVLFILDESQAQGSQHPDFSLENLKLPNSIHEIPVLKAFHESSCDVHLPQEHPKALFPN